jgi:hypothetical protein
MGAEELCVLAILLQGDGHVGEYCRDQLWVPNLVPYNKFRPNNMKKAWEYLDHIARISPERLSTETKIS